MSKVLADLKNPDFLEFNIALVLAACAVNVENIRFRNNESYEGHEAYADIDLKDIELELKEGHLRQSFIEARNEATRGAPIDLKEIAALMEALDSNDGWIGSQDVIDILGFGIVELSSVRSSSHVRKVWGIGTADAIASLREIERLDSGNVAARMEVYKHFELFFQGDGYGSSWDDIEFDGMVHIIKPYVKQTIDWG